MFPANAGYLPPLPSFPFAVPAPSVDPDEGTQRAFCLAQEWIPVVLAALQALTLPTTWQGNEAAILEAQQRSALLVQMFANPSLCAVIGAVQIRHNTGTDMIQTSYDGGVTWVDTPSADPRHNTLLPPLGTADPRCDNAATMLLLLQTLVQQLLDGVQQGRDALLMVSAMLAVMTILGFFGVFVVVIEALVAAALAAGFSALSAAFTSTEWDDLLCILYCNLQGDGTLTGLGLANVVSDVNANLPTLTAAILGYYFNSLGEAGLNDARAVVGVQTGVCTACTGCGWCYEFDFTVSNGGFTAVVAGSLTEGHWVSGQGWVSNGQNDSCSNHHYIAIYLNVPGGIPDLTEAYVEWAINNANGSAYFLDQDLGSTIVRRTSFSTAQAAQPTALLPLVSTPTATRVALVAFTCSSTGETVSKLRLRGSGSNPFGADNCI